MRLAIRRIILFTEHMTGMAAFYGDVLGLELLTDDAGWKEFGGGGCKLSLHRGKATPGAKPPKLVFYAADVAEARALLVARGAAMGKLKASATLTLAEGKDPDGNPFQISNRP
jgi:hypothetical protein